MSQNEERPITLSQFVPYRMVNLATSISSDCSSVYRESFGITTPEWRVLARLAEQYPLNSKELGIAAFMDKSKVSRAINAMDKKALIFRSTDEKDKRAEKLSLTPKGLDLYREVAQKVLAWEADMLSALSKSEAATLTKIMDKLDKKLCTMKK